jgi:hypothetical protein
MKIDRLAGLVRTVIGRGKLSQKIFELQLGLCF